MVVCLLLCCWGEIPLYFRLFCCWGENNDQPKANLHFRGMFVSEMLLITRTTPRAKLEMQGEFVFKNNLFEHIGPRETMIDTLGVNGFQNVLCLRKTNRQRQRPPIAQDLTPIGSIHTGGATNPSTKKNTTATPPSLIIHTWGGRGRRPPPFCGSGTKRRPFIGCCVAASGPLCVGLWHLWCGLITW